MSNPAAEILAYPLNKHMGAYDVQFVWQCGDPRPPYCYYFDLAWWPDLPPPLSTDPILVGTNIAFPATNGGPPVLMRVLDWTWVPSDGDWTLIVTVGRSTSTNNGPESDGIPDPIVAAWHEVGDPDWLPWFRRTAIPTGPSPDDIRYDRVAIWGETAQGQVRG